MKGISSREKWRQLQRIVRQLEQNCRSVSQMADGGKNRVSAGEWLQTKWQTKVWSKFNK